MSLPLPSPSHSCFDCNRALADLFVAPKERSAPGTTTSSPFPRRIELERRANRSVLDMRHERRSAQPMRERAAG